MATHIITVRDFDEYQELAVKLKAEGKNPLVIDMTGNCNDIVIISGDVKVKHFVSDVFCNKIIDEIDEILDKCDTNNRVVNKRHRKLIPNINVIFTELDF